MVVPSPGDGLDELLERIADVGHGAGVEINYKTPIGISAGSAIFPQDATDAESLLEKADERMYEDKRRRKATSQSGQVIVFPKPRNKQSDSEKPVLPGAGVVANKAGY